MTHDELLAITESYAASTRGGAIVCESGGGGESPDVLQVADGLVITYEVKVSRADFLANDKKTHEWMGEYRYFSVPAGLITPQEAEQRKHGLLEYDGMALNPTSVAPRCTGNLREALRAMERVVKGERFKGAGKPAKQQRRGQEKEIFDYIEEAGMPVTAGEVRRSLNITTRADKLADQIKQIKGITAVVSGGRMEFEIEH